MSTSAPVRPSRTSRPDSSKPTSGANAMTLAELEAARATVAFLRQRNDPVQFWEALLLARNRRAIPAPADGRSEAVAPGVEAALVQELGRLREAHSGFVHGLRALLEGAPDLPEPAERFEMALAFLMASDRDRQAAARWLEEPEVHREKASRKLRSLAVISDIYRDALLPWTLGGPEDRRAESGAPAPERQAAAPPEPAPHEPQAPGSIDPKRLESLRLAVRCCKVLAGFDLKTDLWEALLLATTEPGAVRGALEKAVPALQVGRPQDVQAEADRLFGKVLELREAYGQWVRLLYAHMVQRGLATGNRGFFEVGLGLLVADPAARERLGHWVGNPAGSRDEAAELLAPCVRLAGDYFRVLKGPRA